MSSMTLVRRIKARPVIVWDALTTPEGIRHWWGPDAGPVVIAESDVRIGGRFGVIATTRMVHRILSAPISRC